MTVKFCKNVRRLKNSSLDLNRILISTTKIARVNCAKAEFLKNSTVSYFFVQNFADVCYRRIRLTICIQNFARKAEILVVKAADFN